MGAHLCSLAVILSLLTSITFAEEADKQVFFGDTHVHSSFSFDSYALGNQSAGPDTAYRYAKGLPVVHPGHKSRVRIGTPLDFLVVADHAEMMGTPYMLSQRASEYLESKEGRQLVDKFFTPEGREEIFGEFFRLNRTTVAEKPGMGLDNRRVAVSIWKESYMIAERHNEPGKFTTFIGWEWSPTPDGNSLHRVIFMPNGPDLAKRFIPFSGYDSKRPEDLWNWLDKVSSETGAEFVAIPHNSNLSGGLAFAPVDSAGRPVDAEYARKRMKWEKVVEVSQAKGDSETHPVLSPNDDFADFERFGSGLIKVTPDGEIVPQTVKPGSYVRPTLLKGLQIETRVGINPFKFGMIGSTDQHTGVPSPEEDNFHGKFPRDATPESGLEPYGIWKNKGWDFSASGLAAVWAEANTREALFAAFKRREVYATTGTRIRVRFFGGWDFSEHEIASEKPGVIGYKRGVPMGGDLTDAPPGKAPAFLLQAMKDPVGANLDRIQIIKSSLDDGGNMYKMIYDVAWSDGRKVGSDGKLPPVGNTVDRKTATYSNTIGDSQLSVMWTDPEFDSKQRAFYYARVLEIPTPRHSLYDAVALNMEHPDEYPATIQERAYTSPIWYTP